MNDKFKVFEHDRQKMLANLQIERILHPDDIEGSYKKRLIKSHKINMVSAPLPEFQRKVLEEYNTKKKLEDNCNEKSRALYLTRLYHFALFVKKPFNDVTKQDIIKFFNSMENRKGKTVNGYKETIKNFFQWLYKTDKGLYPEMVSWVRKDRRSESMKLPEEVLTEEEVLQIIKYSDNVRDKALIAVGYESACRSSELMGLRIKHVTFDEYGSSLIINGKTGQRRVRIINSVPYLKSWVNQHPFKDDMESPLWINLSRNRYGKPLFSCGFSNRLKTLAKRAGIKKSVYPHILRHSRATSLAKILTEQELKIFCGWTKTSPMASVYVHLSGGDVEHKLLQSYGVIQNKVKVGEVMQPKTCNRCGEINSTDVKFCNKCYYPLEIDAVNQLEQLKSVINDFITTKLLQKPGFVEELPKLVKEWRRDGKQSEFL